jgi:hypothetical protein
MRLDQPRTDVEDARAGGEEDGRLLKWLDQDALHLVGAQLRLVDGGRGDEDSRG